MACVAHEGLSIGAWPVCLSLSAMRVPTVPLMRVCVCVCVCVCAHTGARGLHTGGCDMASAHAARVSRAPGP